MKFSLYFLCILFTLLLMLACAKKKGCLNEWADNYEREAIVNCCCTFSSTEIIATVIGEYTLKEKCSAIDSEYQISVAKDPESNEGIIISNFNNSGSDVKAKWDSGEFRLNSDWTIDDCHVNLTGSIHKVGGKLHFVYAALPSGSDCNDFKGKTCEARVQ